ncbi:S8 family serine peptidase [Phytoactinopolyspora halotolerans]|uniref:S8 family serine peptidase n=1 Tax=Phytoactinopolyspora halotolerans TaxID=1981512 RepID=A0A6L9SI75_9ACTN|nr:S8 family serine peptidase [Phytoactinopolyspora halotolerans]NEE04041.1 S8 family serine peptidase [Phytoactinopolyspora halotolerans]
MSSTARMRRHMSRIATTTAAAGLAVATALAGAGYALAAPDDDAGHPDLADPAARGTAESGGLPDLLGTTLGDGLLTPPTSFHDDGRYLVVLADAPAATYTGGADDLPATAADGQGFDAGTSAARRYRDHLHGQQAEVAARVGADPAQQYSAAVNAFAADLDATQAAELQQDPRVLAVVPDTAQPLDTVQSPDHLGLPGDDGVWEELGGVDSAGMGVVVGIVDSGLWPENPSFAGSALPSAPSEDVGRPYRTSETETAMVKANGELFTGECQTGERWDADDCTDKVISARYFADGFLGSVPPGERDDDEFASPRDGQGHGSHVTGIAAGNTGVPMSIDGQDLGAGSGMAPAAKIAAYKACWTAQDPEAGGCFLSDVVAAVDQAVVDNVDILNLSIAGFRDTAADVISLALLSAASADIFVAVSAGNHGPGASTVAHNNPWVATVAAGTHAGYPGTVELGDGRRFRGAMLHPGGLDEQTPLVRAGDIAASGATADEATLCMPDSLDEERADGALVLCDRGEIPRTDKSDEVARAGGVGMILGNTDPDETLDPDSHAVPTVQLSAADADHAREYIAESAPDGATAALLPGDQTDLPPAPSPVLAGFSSRGPALANDGDLLKPDLTAPGVNVLSAVTPGYTGQDGDAQYGFLSGTSMASPHVAGIAALLRAEHPDWSPAAIKSALMTSTSDLVDAEGSPDRDRFGSGAGYVDPGAALSPGLVYDATADDWLSFLAGTGAELDIPGVEPIDPSNLNYPSISIGALAGKQQVVREVTATRPGLYVADVDVPGFAAHVSPSVLLFTQPGQTKRFRVVLTRDDADLEQYAHGTLTWRGAGTAARSPVVVNPVGLDAPDEVSGDGPSGQIEFDVVSGQDADTGVTLRGLAPGEVTDGSLTPGEPPKTGGNASSHLVSLDVGDGATLARFDLVAGAATADFDMYLFGPDGRQLPVEAATAASSERVDLPDPEPGTYWALVHVYSTADGEPVDFSLRNFAVGGGPAGNATVAPERIVGEPGSSTQVTVEYDGLGRGVPYLGVVDYDGTGPGTVVSIG